MLTALWRCLWKGSRGRAPRKCLRRNHALSCRPCLESLESRELPAVLGSGLFAPVVPNAPSISQAPMLPGCTRPICVTVAENSPQTVIDMGPVFAAIPGIQYQDGLQLAVLVNTNSALVRTELSDSALILTYRSGQSGTATIVVCATDADGVSVRQTLLVTVRPPSPAGATGAGAIPLAPPALAFPGIWR